MLCAIPVPIRQEIWQRAQRGESTQILTQAYHVTHILSVPYVHGCATVVPKPDEMYPGKTADDHFAPRQQYEVLEVARSRESTEQFRQAYANRAGVE
jgi:hypothetical protein